MTTNIKITKTMQLYDEATRCWYDIYQAPGIEGGPVEAEVSRDKSTAGEIRRMLLKNGAILPALDACKLALQAAIDDTEAPIGRRAAHGGWGPEGRFVSFCHVAGVPEGQTVLPLVSPFNANDQIAIRGTLAGWKELIAVAKYSTTMIIALCASFAAPLLGLLQRPSFGLVIFGTSRGGKSQALIAGSSAIGFGRDEDLPNLDATHAGLLAAGLAFNGHLLPIDEVGTARGGKKVVGSVMRSTTYSLMGGHDTTRHPTFNGGGTGSFKVLPLLSSEYSPDEWAARGDDTRDAGETVRLIGVPAFLPGATIFDSLPDVVADEDGAAWDAEQFRRLREGLPHQRGVALRDYITELTRAPDDHKARASSLVSKFESKVTTPTMSPVERDIAAKFGLLYAGGMLAAEWDVLPLKPNEILAATREGYMSAIGCLPNSETDLRKDLKRFKKFLEANSIVDLDRATRRQVDMIRSANGYVKAKECGREYVVLAKAFGLWMRTDAAARRILEWADEEGCLVGKVSVPRQTTWPDGSRPRCFIFYFPKGLDDIERMIS